MPIITPLSQVITPANFRPGKVEPIAQSGLDLFPIQTGEGRVSAVISNFGGNILSCQVESNNGPVQMTPCFLDFSHSDIPNSGIEMMGKIGGLTPFMFPLAGRTTQLHNSHPVSNLAGIKGWRSLNPNTFIHGITQNRLWKITDHGRNGDSHKISAEFSTDWVENIDVNAVFGDSKVNRDYVFSATADGGKVEITTTISGNLIGAIGDHSYLNTPNRNGWRLEAEADHVWQTGENNVPTGELINSEQFTKLTSLDGIVFDSIQKGLTVNSNSGLGVAELEDSGTGNKIFVEQSHANRGIFIPNASDGSPEPFMCIEPFSSPADSLRLAALNSEAKPLIVTPDSPVTFKQVYSFKFAK